MEEPFAEMLLILQNNMEGRNQFQYTIKIKKQK